MPEVRRGDPGPFGWHKVEAAPTGPSITLMLEWRGAKESLTIPADRGEQLRHALESLIENAVEWQEESQ